MIDDWTTRSGKWRRSFTLELVRRYGAVCCICGLPIKPADVSCQHVVPRSKGGRTTFENCRPAHKSCNYSLKAKATDGPAGVVHDGLSKFLRGRS
ncbi:HNH endonuclease [Schaalia vaccimaxillae]|uniref:HNH endonuclease n=1 Tax=Schaalia vaccimaxillae TaxID=183916 RepID=UPI000A0514D4